MPTYTTSGSYNFTTNRDGIITRALRIIGAIGQGETPSSTAVTEAAEALNDICKEWEADGMQLWCLKNYSITPVASTASYNIGVGATVNTVAPLKVTQAWYRKTSGSLDTPMVILARSEYETMSNKTQTGTPSMVWYNPPGSAVTTGDYNDYGVATYYVVPDATFASGYTFGLTGVRPIEDFDAATDVPDFPKYWYNAVKWGLADQLAYEYGVGVTQRAQISKKAEQHKAIALSYGTEEGSVYLQPRQWWNR